MKAALIAALTAVLVTLLATVALFYAFPSRHMFGVEALAFTLVAIACGVFVWWRRL